MMREKLAQLRIEFLFKTLDIVDVDKDPFKQFEIWMDEAIQAESVSANSVALATVDENLQPTLRMVLLKDVDNSGFQFFSNYQSQKGYNIAKNNKAALLFFWPELQRQIRIEGIVEKTSYEVSQAYFATRPRGSQIAAWASPQSQVVKSRSDLELRFKEVEQRFENQAIPCPEFWGGYNLKPDKMEFWQGRLNRLHDRLLYQKTADGNNWVITRLAP